LSVFSLLAAAITSLNPLRDVIVSFMSAVATSITCDSHGKPAHVNAKVPAKNTRGSVAALLMLIAFVLGLLS
jgi:hypothetical protein